MQIPREIVFLGLVVEITLIEDDTGEEPKRVTYDLKGTSLMDRQRSSADRRCWILATDAESMNAPPGESRLFLIQAPYVRDQIDLPRHEPDEETIEAFRQWTDRAPDKTIQLDTPDDIDEYYGQIVEIVYASDKREKKGKVFEYVHDFYENKGEPPDIFFDAHTPDDSRAAIIIGGSMSVDERGIV